MLRMAVYGADVGALTPRAIEELQSSPATGVASGAVSPRRRA